MDISIDGVLLFSLTDAQKQVLAWEISSDILNDDLKRRLQWVLMHKYEVTFQEFKNYWESYFNIKWGEFNTTR